MTQTPPFGVGIVGEIRITIDGERIVAVSTIAESQFGTPRPFYVPSGGERKVTRPFSVTGDVDSEPQAAYMDA